MDKHYTVLGALFIGLGIMGLVGMLVVFVIFSLGSALLGSAAMQDPNVPPFVALIPVGFATFIVAIIALSTVPSLIVGYGLLARKEWAKVGSLVVGVLNLPQIPFGTAVGVYAIWVYLTESNCRGVAGPPSRV